MDLNLPDERHLFMQDLCSLVSYLEQGAKDSSEDWTKCETVLKKLLESTVRILNDLERFL